MSKERLTNILVFTLLAVIIGFSIPFLYHNFNNDAYYYELVNFTAEDIRAGETSQKVLLVRNIPYDMHGRYFHEMNLIDADGHVNVYTRKGDTLFEHRADNEIRFILFDIPSDLEPGSYYWESLVELEVYTGVKKTYSIKSNVFEVKEPLI